MIRNGMFSRVIQRARPNRTLASIALILACATTAGLFAREHESGGNVGSTPANQFTPQFLSSKLLKDAKTAIENRQFRTAWSLAAAMTRGDDPGLEGIREQAKALLALIDDKAAELYDAAEKHWWYREYDDAEKQYRELFEQFPHCEHFVDARNRLACLRFMPGFASKKLFEAAAAKEAAGQYLDAEKRYTELINQYPETVAAIKAKKALLALQSDPTKQKAISAELQAVLLRDLDLKLRKADNYLANPPQDESDWVLYDRGVAFLHEIIALAPGSEQAKKAHARIQQEQDRIAAEAKARDEARQQAAAELAAAEEQKRNR
ncbi:MAG TPA: hypothetical protein VL860_02870 [Planctomycetota bacterium]|nr:hypothetical protein [Planctomycetota bacterium]